MSNLVRDSKPAIWIAFAAESKDLFPNCYGAILRFPPRIYADGERARGPDPEIAN